MGKEVLKIEKREYGFGLRIGDELYFISDKGSGWFALLIKNEDGEVTNIIDDKYENLGAENLEDLLCKLVTRPSETLEMLIGGKRDIKKVVVYY